ncbi:hypothetical protein [Coxiella burnetii]|uniref:hypothetical protein n=1 Tax=Coxiella burnetii TaxID=777 RepID=UPI00051F1726|nr:hypothetical protein CBNA_0646 [Coxiella burnetii str. Namibia]
MMSSIVPVFRFAHTGYFTVKGCIAEKRMQAALSTPVFKKSGRLSNFDEIALNYYT